MSKKRLSLASNLTNKIFYVLIAIIIFAAIGATVYAATTGLISPQNPGHNSSQVFISVGSGKYVTLQNAIDSGYSIGANASPIATTLLPVSTPYHLASQILVNIGGYTMTLQEAIIYGVLGGGATASYTTILPPGGEYASNINVNTISGVTDFQSAVANSLLSPCPLGQHLNSQNNCVATCVSNYGTGNTPCYPSGASSTCTNAGTVQCDGSCSGFSYLRFGTQSSCSTDTACDGIGHCQGYSGTGCSGCPFGHVNGPPANDGTYNIYCIDGYTTGGTWSTTYLYAATSYLDGVTWGTRAGTSSQDSSFFLCHNTYTCSCYSGSCSPPACTETDYSWKMKPNSFIQAR